MPSFALITEGVTDQAALESILCGFYDEEPEFRQIQPPRDETDEQRQGDFGGWEKVLEFCSLQKFADIFSTNDYVIIQIDTDVCEQKNFDIPLTEHGKDIPCNELVQKVKKFITSKMDAAVFDACKDRIFFAISVHSLECWLIPPETQQQANKTKNCWKRLHRIFAKKNQELEKTYVCYQQISKHLDRKKNLLASAGENESLKIFIDSLPALIE